MNHDESINHLLCHRAERLWPQLLPKIVNIPELSLTAISFYWGNKHSIVKQAHDGDCQM